MKEIKLRLRKNALLFYFIFGGLALTRMFYIYYFSSAGSIYMTVFNIFSVVFYVILFCLFLFKSIFKVLNLLVYEICLHAFFAALAVGAGNGFEIFLISTVFASLHILKITKSRKITAYITILFAFLLFLTAKFLPDLADLSFFRVYPEKSSLDLIFIFNTVMTFVMIVLILLVYLSYIKTDEEKLKLLNYRLAELASHDSLTQLLNRRAMKQRLEAALEIRKRSSIGFVTAIADIDDFKKINDQYGHDCGDKVLKKVVQVIKENVRDTDCISRWGGDEILILFNNSSLEGALTCINRIHKEINNSEFMYNNETIALTITVGVCQSENYSTYQDVILEADRRLYDGKHKGKNRIISDSPLIAGSRT